MIYGLCLIYIGNWNKIFNIFGRVKSPIFENPHPNTNSFLGHYCQWTKKQGQKLIDSLIREIPKAKEDSGKVLILSEICNTYYNINPDYGIKYGNQALELAEKLKWNKGMAVVYRNLGNNYLTKSDYSKALDYFKKAYDRYQNSGNKLGLASVLISMGNVYFNESNFTEAMNCYFKGLKIDESLDNKSGMASEYGNLAVIYMRQKNLKKALEYDSLSLKAHKGLNAKGGMAAVLGNIGNIYLAMDSFDKALQYDFRALKLFEETGAKSGIARNYQNISIIYANQKNYKKECEYIFKAYHLNVESGDEVNIAENLANIGEFYQTIVKDSASNIAADSLIPESRTERLKKSVFYLKVAIEKAKKINDYDLLQFVYNCLSTTYQMLHNDKDALENFKLYTNIKDSVFSLKSKTDLANLETARALQLKDKQIEIDKLEVAKKRNERMFFMAGILLLLVIIFVIFRNYKAQKQTNLLLNYEKKRSDDLLLNILPAEVAEELKNKGSADARHFENVTVMFTDFVNFTTASEEMEPAQLIGELDNCFKAFDEILNKYQIEKIKTIGDAYLAVSGLPVSNGEHAAIIVAAAREIRDFMLERRKNLGTNTFEVRIGIHSGNVVAGIVGVKKFAYDIWGDTVNIAARMEQNSVPGKINISQTTFEMVKDQFQCTFRGAIPAKNKGDLNMYFVD